MTGECSRCGAKLPESGGFCLSCGESINQTPHEATEPKDSGTRRAWIIGGSAVVAAALLGLGSAVALSASSGDEPAATGNTTPVTSDSATPPATGTVTTAPPSDPANAGQSWVPATSLPGGELPEPATVAPKTYSAPSSPTAISGQSSQTIAQAIVQNYVSAVNSGDYSQAYGYTTDAWQDNHSYSGFVSGMDTATISDLQILSTTSDPTVSVQYRSNQSSSDSPNGETCLIWNLRFEFADEGNGYRISKIKELSSPPYRSC